ncbi:HAMP domain-containing histidine kinase [Fulvivirga sp. 29W222]|uniref:histidine kinase n=1 Tax=Fulvivirga marina TaxID=2494733 RepID=A0A937G0P9_9BACT|nr:HAMP domain-containing sensor histidine kinase [Fulvivirga marina]MBL6447953.1 HAMP domain-containing histidine kinase [Fulvivirga marina]
MLVKNLWVVLLSVLFFCGIIGWQLNHLGELKTLRDEIFNKQAKNDLRTLGTALKSSTAWGEEGFDIDDLDHEMVSSFQCAVDSLLQLYFEDEAMEWGVIDKDRDSVVLASVSEKEYWLLKTSEVETCLSCLVSISFTDQEGGMIINHSVADIRAMFGTDEDVMFLAVFRKDNQRIAWPDYLVFVFVIGLSLLFAFSIYLNSRQKKLIEQKNEFINHLSHQFKTPLASIRLGTNMLLKSDEFMHNKMLHIIHLESNRLEKHIQTVLQWVKSGAQGLQLNCAVQDVVAVTRHALRQMDPVFKQEQVIVQTDFEKEEVMASVDEYHLTLVYFNLWENAIKHNPSGLRLTIVMKVQGEYLSIEHRDNGQGFDPNKPGKNSMFTGLGLLYVKKVMKAHKGSVEIISSPEEEGTQIVLRVPLAELKMIE